MAHAARELDYDIKVKIGEEEIDMLPFVQEIVGNSIIGMMSALRGYEAGKEIEIKITPSK